MVSTSFLYFLVAIFGESIEGSGADGLQLTEGQEDEITESGHNEEQEAAEIHNESSVSPEQRLQEKQALEQNTNDTKHVEVGEETEHSEGGEETLHQEAPENQRRALEFPLSISAGIGYAAIGLWMILDKRINKTPYIIAIIGSIVLLGIYFASRTVGIFTLGTEPFGIFDVSVAGLQVAIITTSLYILIGKIYTKGMTVGK